MKVLQDLQMEFPISNDANAKHLSVASVDNSCLDYDLSTEEEEALMEYERELQKQSVEIVRDWITTQCKFDDFEEDSTVKYFDLKLAENSRRRHFPSGSLQALIKPHLLQRPGRAKKPSPPQMSSNSSRALVGQEGQASASTSTGCKLESVTTTSCAVTKNFPEDFKSRNTFFEKETSSSHTVEEILDHYENSFDCNIEPAFEFNLDNLLVPPGSNNADCANDGIETTVTTDHASVILEELPSEPKDPVDVQEQSSCLHRHCARDLRKTESIEDLPHLQKNKRLEMLADEFKKAVQTFWSSSEVFSKQIKGNNCNSKLANRELVDKV